MKNLIFILFAIVFTTQLKAQNIIDRYYSDLAERDDITSVYVAGKMFNYASYIDVSDDEELRGIQEFLTSIHSFNVIVVPGLENPFQEYKNGVKRVQNDYEELLRIKDTEGSVSFYINENNGTVYELVGIAAADEKFIVGTLMGEMELDKIASMINKIKANDGDTNVLDRFNESGIGEWKVYPNPVNAEGIINIEVPEKMIGSEARLYDNNGSLLKTMNINQMTQEMGIQSVAPGQYYLEIKNETVSMKKKIMVIK